MDNPFTRMPQTSQQDSFEQVARLAQIPEPGVLAVVKSSGERICLVRHGGRVAAFADNCSHQDFAMSLGDVLPDGTIQCAWHGARFDCITGAVRQGPATQPLRRYSLQIEEDRVLVGSFCTAMEEDRILGVPPESSR